MQSNGTFNEGRSAGETYRFGDVVLDATAHTLLRDGQPQSVEPKAFAVLLVLLRHAGQLIEHEQLLDAVWGHRHVTPGVLTRAIAQLRAALDDRAHEPRYIQTQHALGYRFIGEVLPEPVAESPATDAAGFDQSASPEADTSTTDEVPTGDTQQPPPAGLASTLILTDASAPLRQSNKRLWLLVVALVAVAAGSLIWQQRKTAPARPVDASIAVLPFASLSSNRDDTYFAEGLAVEMHDALAGVPGLKVAACNVGSACGMRSGDAKSLGKTLGVATVLDADVRREGDQIRISARLADTRTGFTLWSGSYDRELTDVFALQREIAGEVVRSLLGVLPAGPDNLTLRLQPTKSVTAYDAYLKGVQNLRARDDKRSGEAIGFFSEALAADPGFARAQAGICRAEIIRFEGAHDAAAFERAQAACRRAAAMDPGLREVNLALGDLHQARGDSVQAVAYFKQAMEDVALRPDAYVGLAKAEKAQGHNDLAADYFQQALLLRPGDATIHRALGMQEYIAGNLSRAIEAYVTASSLEPSNEASLASLGGLYMRNGDADRAADAFGRSLAIKPSFDALCNLGTLRFEAGAYAEAAGLFRRAVELDPEDPRAWGNLGDALSALPTTATQAREPYQRAAQMTQQYVDIKPGDAHSIAVLSWYRANLGQAQAARDLVERAEALSVEKSEVAFWAAQSLALLGDEAAARERVEQALAGGIPRQRLRTSPVLRNLVAGDNATTTKAGE